MARIALTHITHPVAGTYCGSRGKEVAADLIAVAQRPCPRCAYMARAAVATAELGRFSLPEDDF